MGTFWQDIRYGLRTLRRSPGFTVRMALGANRLDVIRMILREATLLVLTGVVLEVAGAVAATRLAASFITGLLFGLTATDPLTIGISALLLMAVAMSAGYFPAWRASCMDPMVALRYE